MSAKVPASPSASKVVRLQWQSLKWAISSVVEPSWVRSTQRSTGYIVALDIMLRSL